MKKLALIFLTITCLVSSLFAQAPEAFKYQAVLRNADGELIAGQDVLLKVSILDMAPDGEALYSEEHSAVTNPYGVVSLTIGEGTILSGNFTTIPWNEGDKFLKIEIDDSGGSSYSELGTFQLLSVPYALFASSASKLGNNVEYSASPDTLFVVKDHEGKAVFVVYPDGAEVITNNNLKGRLGGFAVSGRTSTKGINSEYLIVTPDSTRIYVNENVSKSRLGGFAVSGRTSTKGLINDYLFVTGDSTRVYVNEDESKGRLGGFAVSGRTSTKGINSDYLRVTPDSTRIYVNEGAGKSRLGGFAVSGRTSTKGFLNDYFNVSGVGATGLNIIDPSEPRMLWYPKSEAFLVGRVIIEDPDSVGLNSISTGYESKAIGDYSHALGYQSIARNNYSTAIGKNAVADGESSYAFGDNAFTKISADNSYAIGTNATAQGSNSYAFGNGTIANGNGSFAFGAGGRDSTGVAISEATIAEGDNAFAMGLGATAYGVNSFSIGTSTSAHGENAFALGLGTIATGKYSTAMGYQNTASGKGSMAWGGYRSYSVDYSNEASGDVSTAWGIKTTASGRNSTAWGEANEASGRNSTAWGGYNISRSYATTAWGWNCEALERYNTAFGWGAKAKAYTSTAAGIGTAATSYGSFVIGRSNDTIYNHTDINYYDNRTPESYMLWFDDDPLFVVGNGWNHPLVGNKNALTVLKNGTTIVGWNTSVDNSEINPDARYNLSVKVPYDNGFIFYVHGQAGGTSSWNEISDIRLKQNIKTIDGALDKVLKLRGVTFEWKDKERKGLNIGFIAQEAKEILPEVVTGSEETKYSMQYAPITAVLVEAMKEQQNEIEQLKEQNKLLLDRLKKIEEKLEK